MIFFVVCFFVVFACVFVCTFFLTNNCLSLFVVVVCVLFV